MHRKSQEIDNGMSILLLFGRNFLEDHARTLISDPQIALVELIANCWDAGANRVDILWPSESVPDVFKIQDDGTGMTYQEFMDRWRELNYNRKEAQGEDVVFPLDNQRSKRKAYGTNGKGRHSVFCFANEYSVETWRDGTGNRFVVKRPQGSGAVPYLIVPDGSFGKEGHGTIISAELVRNYVDVNTVRDLIGSKFIADPGLRIYVNGELVEFSSLEHLIGTRGVAVQNVGTILVHCVDSQKTGRTSKQHGVAWWVNKRLVGEPSWKGFDEDAYLDARTAEAHRYTFVVEADILADDVREDWSDFRETSRFMAVKSKAKESILAWLRELMKDVHKSRKIAAASAFKKELKELSVDSRYQIGRFIDEIQSRVTTIDGRLLSATVGVLSKLEKARSGYVLLEQLAKLDPDDLDELNRILASWSVQEARIVLDELGRRLKLIKSLEKVLENPSSDELHDIQPLFEKGLWIFGPEYESLQFMSNQSLASIVSKFFEGKVANLTAPRRRPDFVVLPDSSIGVYAHDSYDSQGEVEGLGKVLIVELKRGGFEITRKERGQAQEYANEIRRSGKIQRSTQIIGFVLGATLAADSQDPLSEGVPPHTIIYPRAYSTVLRQANARTFNLQKKIEEAKGLELSDPEIEGVIASPDQGVLPLPYLQ